MLMRSSAQSPDQHRAADDGSVPNWHEAFGYRPELMDAWIVMLGCIQVRMQPRRFELVTMTVAHALGSRYCALAHGAAMREFYSDDDIIKIVKTGPEGEADGAITDYVRAIALDATSVDAVVIDRLRGAGLAEAEICDIAAAAAARCFFSKYMDALGVQPDTRYADLPEALRDALAPGWPD